MIERLQCLTQDLQDKSHIELVKLACQSGIKWIQLRIKNDTKENILETALKAKEICVAHNVKLIINDHVDICQAVAADGVHLGQEDLAISEARKILGAQVIIGATANTYLEAEKQIQAGANYIGLGPYRFTSTKDKLKPTLGLDGVQHFLAQISVKYPGFPVIVIGGIKHQDVQDLLAVGAHGVAVSSAINLAPDYKQAAEDFIESFGR